MPSPWYIPPVIAIYARISDDPLALRAGVTRQLDDCRTLAARLYPSVPCHIYEDNDTSAYSTRQRPAYTRLCQDISSGLVSIVIAYNLDRLFRRPIELESFIEICTAHHVVCITAQGDLDLTTHDGQLQARILVAVARKSSDDTSRRVTRAQRDRAEHGAWIGAAPYPYVNAPGTLAPRSVASFAVARRAYDIIMGGGSFASLPNLRTLDPTAPATRHGWTHALKSPALSGTNTFGYPGNWTPILSPIEHATLLSAMSPAASQLRRVPSNTRIHYLSSLVYCSGCSTRMLSSKTGNLSIYRCNTCYRSVTRIPLEHIISNALFARAPVSPPPPLLPTPIPQSSDRLSELAVLYTNGTITREEWLAARSAALPRLPAQHPTPAPALPDDLEAAWPSLSAPTRHSIAAFYLDRILILPGLAGSHRLLPRVQLLWKR